jgi:murein DD-endopeptidase MepM/ murein hydrolase activator NlpD
MNNLFKRKKIKVYVWVLTITTAALLTIGYVFGIDKIFVLPVDKMNAKDYNQKSFWMGPWGASIVHKGVDIFGKIGTNIFSSTPGIVVIKGYNKIGGNAVMVLSPDLKVHYYSHLESISSTLFSTVSAGEKIGTLGDTGNAKGKPPHLHYGIHTLLPFIWNIDLSKRHGLRKMFYVDPILYLNAKLNFKRKK